jgi:hypothetical protein
MKVFLGMDNDDLFNNQQLSINFLKHHIFQVH